MSLPSKGWFQKKPIRVYAQQWYPGEEIEGVEEIRHSTMGIMGRIKTLEDTDSTYHWVTPGDYVITGVQGEKYACKEDIFNETYDHKIAQNPKDDEL